MLVLSGMVFGDGAFARCLGPEGGALMNGILALIKETAESSLAPFHHMKTQQEDRVCEPRSEPDTEPCQNFAFGRSRLQDCGSYISGVRSRPACGILLEQSGETKVKG